MNLEEYRESLIDEVRISASESGNMEHEEFVLTVIEELCSVDECGNFERAYFNDAVRKGRKVEIYGYDIDDYGILSLFAGKWNGTSKPETFSRSDIVTIAKRALAFFEEAIDGEIQKYIDESNPAYSAACDMNERQRLVKGIKIFVITDNFRSERIKNLEIDDFKERKVGIYLWAVEDVYELMGQKKGYDDRIIRLSDLGVDGVPCVEAYLGGSSLYKSYMCALPAEVLCQMFDKYRGQLLESNVRSYLGKQKKANKEMRKTVNKMPYMFFSYNNGITATALDVSVEERSGMPVITGFNYLQIVNGGQTTVTLYELSQKSENKNNLSQVYVPLKVTVLPSDVPGNIVSDISRAANTQSVVSQADFFSNHQFHKDIRKIADEIYVPKAPGSIVAARWYYESARGQYTMQQIGMSKSELAMFKKQYPKDHLISKTDLAKYRVSYDGRPQLACGLDKAFKEFAKEITERYESGNYFVNEKYFKDSVAMAIIVRELDKSIRTADWYRGYYRMPIALYALAKITDELKKYDRMLNLSYVWDNQSMGPAMTEQMLRISESIHEYFYDDHENIVQWIRQGDCWTDVKNIPVEFSEEFRKKCVVSSKSDNTSNKKSIKEKSDKSKMNAQIEFVNRGPAYWQNAYEWALDNEAIEGEDKILLRDAASKFSNNVRDYPTPKKCEKIVAIRDELRMLGFKG